MKVNIIIPFKRLSGGIRVIYIYADYLTRMGHDVCCYLPAISYPGKGQSILFRIKASISNMIKPEHWYDCNFPVKVVPAIKDPFIREADIVIASSWQTAYDVKSLSDIKGKKIYFVQGYEVFNGEEKKVIGTYQLGIPIITITKSLADVIGKYTKSVDVIYNGLFPDEFIQDAKPVNEKLTLLVFFHESPDKGTRLALQVVDRIKSKFDVDVIVFGRKISYELDSDFKVYENPSRNVIHDIYKKTDIYLFTSQVDAWGLTAVEAMANKCAIIGTDIGAVHELNDGTNCIIAKSEENFIDAIIRLNEDRTLLQSLQENAYKTVKNLAWENSEKKFENILLDTLE